MTHHDLHGTTERYRLRRSVRCRGGGQRLEQLAGHPELFATWREAQLAAHLAGGRRKSVIVQSVLVDAAGAVVFPDAACTQRTSGAWKTRRWAGRSLHAGSGKRRRGQATGKAAPKGAKTSPAGTRRRREPRAPRG